MMIRDSIVRGGAMCVLLLLGGSGCDGPGGAPPASAVDTAPSAAPNVDRGAAPRADARVRQGGINEEENAMGCDASKAEWMIGQPPTEELLARGAADAGAQVSRYIRHDEMVTMEYHPSRLNVDLGEDGLIRAVRCG
jgi:hypothetical protein